MTTETTRTAATTITTPATITTTINHPLELPEIIAHVARYLPLWQVEKVRVPGKTNFHIQRRYLPKTFHSCFLVCMVWYRTLLPIFWRTYDFTVMETRDVPRHVVERYSFLFRRFSSCGGHDGPFHCTLLETLLLSHDHSYCPNPAKRGTAQPQQELLMAKADINMSLEFQRRLIRQNPGLNVLQWEGDRWSVDNCLRRLRAEDFDMLSNLQDLTLAKWDGSNGALVEVLRTVGRTVERLEIRDLYGFKKSDIATSTNLASDGAVVVGGGGRRGEVGTGPVLPRVKVLKLSCFTKTSDLGYIAGCCPDLEVLDLHIARSPFDMKRLASILRSHCRKLTTLIHRQSSDISVINRGEDEGEDSEDGGMTSTLIRGCSLSGLVRIKFEAALIGPTYKDNLRSVLVHSTTLEHLTIDCAEEQYHQLEPMDILRVLIQCRRLKTFSISGWTGRSLPATLKVLMSQPWGCLELEAFSLYIPFSLSDESDDENEFEDDKYEFEVDGDDAESRRALGNWYWHSQGSFVYDINASVVTNLVLETAFDMVKGLDRLLFLTLNSVTYTRSSDPQIMEVLDDFRGL